MFRSPIAAGILQKEIDQSEDSTNWVIRSAGTWTTNGSPLPPITRQIGRQLGLYSIERHRTQQLDEKLLEETDLIVVMEGNHKEAIIDEFPQYKDKIFLLSEIADNKLYDIPDPTSPGIDAEEITSELLKLISTGYSQILDTAKKHTK